MWHFTCRKLRLTFMKWTPGRKSKFEFQQQERVGIVGRSDIGFLIWDKDEDKTATYNIGSRIKTPTYPLWVTKCNDQMGVLFNPNKELMRSHNAENRQGAIRK